MQSPIPDQLYQNLWGRGLCYALIILESSLGDFNGQGGLRIIATVLYKASVQHY